MITGNSKHCLVKKQTNKQTNFLLILGFPVIIVALSLGIVAGKDGVQSFVSDKW